MTHTRQLVDARTAAESAVATHGASSEAIIAILQHIQERLGYLAPAVLERLLEITSIRPADIEGVASFYTQFRRQRVGRHVISVCDGTACHVKGSVAVYDAFRRRLGLDEQGDTDAFGQYTLRKVACLGCCTLAPAVQIDDVTFGHLTPQKVSVVLDEFQRLLRLGKKHRATPAAAAAGGPTILLGLGSCCQARGSAAVGAAIASELAKCGGGNIQHVGCVGMCHQTPVVEVRQDGQSHLYSRVGVDEARELIRRHARPSGLVRRVKGAAAGLLERMLFGEPQPIEHYEMNVRDPQVDAFLRPQVHIATEHRGELDPLDLDQYIAHDGFVAARLARDSMAPDAIIGCISASGLRGRGGAGFPTGAKWSAVRAAQGPIKYVICNGDEGDPGAFMDRMLLESYPYRVIEGMLIAAVAVGAGEGIFYIRAEYPLAVQRVSAALDACRSRGLIGPDAMGKGRGFDIRIVRGAGAFVCGEETALIASIQGQRGTPRLRPPYPSSQGLHGRPTLVNNVETLACVPWIVRNGAGAFSAIGTGDSRGTKVFALAGKVARGGLVEVPMGMTLRQIVEEIGGGVAGGGKVKAVQVGGPSGGCVPASLLDVTVDYQALGQVGAIMGSGGMIVLDESDCMVDIARYFLAFTQDQSCGRCTFCRIGTRRMLDILDRLCHGQGKSGDLERLHALAIQTQQGSLCGLGRTAPNPVLSTLTHFREEYEAHLAGRCPAGRCTSLIRYEIGDDCIGCTICAQNCPADAIEMKPFEKHAIDAAKCLRCGGCKTLCPAKAITVVCGRND